MNKALSCVIGVLAVGCAHYPAPTDQVAKSIAAVRGAQEAGAAEVPAAALHVKLAQEQIEQARRLMEDEQNERAADKAMRAVQDAELAVLLARRSKAQQKLAQYTAANPGAGGEAPALPPSLGATP
jgi:pyridoxal biosynthesis lyase PdxS